MPNNVFTTYTQAQIHDLENIAGIKFTHREIDIIACVLNGRSVKKTGHFLGIVPKTIESHMRNIMMKLECNSREGVIDFIERSDKGPLLRHHYQNLLIHFEFNQILHKVSAYTNIANCPSIILCGHTEEKSSSFMGTLQKYLDSVNLKMFPDKISKDSTFLKDKPFLQVYDTLYLLHSTKANSETLLQKANHPIIYLILKGESIPDNLEPNEYVDFRNRTTFYPAFCELMHKLNPETPVHEITQEFQERYKAILGTSSPLVHKSTKKEIKVSTHKNKWAFFKNPKYIFILGGLLLTAFLIWIITLGASPDVKIESQHSIRSDLLIPTKLLKRPHLITKIDEKLNAQTGIQTVALVGIVGMGGVGKTTLARQFSRLQNVSIIWEINAETKESLINSFKDLAYALAQTRSQKEELDVIQKIQNFAEKEKQLLSFVKKHLQLHPNWLLIYDNLDEFSEIKKYFPHDPQAWGTGKVLITTRDSNIKNNSYINPEHIIEIGELSPEETLVLFCKILHGCNPDTLSPEHTKKILHFLKNIPPFPLDVSVSAYYIKDTGITYEKYLERITQGSKDLDATQESLLKEVSDYAKTRYGIISLSFKKLIEVHPDYKDLLFVVCLLDSQHIPQVLLEGYKNPTIVEQFMHALRKYSLITSDTFMGDKHQIHTFSLHRSTQYLGKKFLLSIYPAEERKDLIDGLIDALKSFYEHSIYGNFSEKHSTNVEILLPHLEALLKNLNIFSAHRKLKEKYEKDLLLIIGYGHLNDVKNYMHAEKYLTQIYQLELKNRSLPLHTLAILLKDLSEICSMLEDPDKAITYAQESIKLLNNTPGSEIIQIENLKNIGTAYMHKNNFEEAKKYLNIALNKLSPISTVKTKELESELYNQLSWLYSATYFNKEQAYEAIKYAIKSLEIFDATTLFHKNSLTPPRQLSCLVCKHKVNLAYIYMRMGKYAEAMEQGFKEAQYILDNDLDNCKHIFTRIKLSLGVGEVLLRQGKLEAAYEKLTGAIIMSEKLIGANNAYIPLPARTLRAETNIRLKNFKEAYEDCKAVFSISANSHTNSSDLVYTNAFYHAAVIQYTLEELKQSRDHFAEFFTHIQALCKKILEPKRYKELEKKGVFIAPAYHKKRAPEDFKKCLKNSIEIYTAIYGTAHPFVKEYVIPNYEEAKRFWF